MRKGPAWHENWGVRILIGYASWMWIQTFWAVNVTQHIEGCILFTKYVVLFYIIYKVLSDLKTFELFSIAHITGCFIFGWIAYTSTVAGRLDSVGGPGMDDANILAMHQITGAAFAGFLFLALKGRWRWLAFSAIPFILNTIILTGSRGALIGMAGAAMAALVLSPRRQRWVIHGAMALGLVLFLWLSHDMFWARMETIKVTEESEMEASARSRIELIRYGLKMAADYPWGAGYRGHRALSAKYLPEYLLTVNQEGRAVRSAHNTFMAVLVEQGIPGSLLFISLQCWIWITLFKLKSSLKRNQNNILSCYIAATGTSLMAVFVCSQFISAMNAEVQFWLIALLAVLIKLEKEYRQRRLFWILSKIVKEKALRLPLLNP